MTRLFSALACLATLAFVPAYAEPLAARCSVKSGASNWISDEFVFSWDVESGVAAVSDRVSLYVNKGKPLPVNISRETRNGVILKWEIALTNRGQNARLKYSANLNTRTGRVNMTALPLGYANKFHGGGTCKMVKVTG